jgi:IS30 family transposase
VNREVAPHDGRTGYRANEADHRAWNSALRPKVCRLARHRKLRLLVASELILDLSPEQISGWLKRRYPNNESVRVSHETIYRSLFILARLLPQSQHFRKQCVRKEVPRRELPTSLFASC